MNASSHHNSEAPSPKGDEWRVDRTEAKEEGPLRRPARLAAHIFDTPVARVQLGPPDRPWTAARVEEASLLREANADAPPQSLLYAPTLAADAPVVVSDLTADERAADHPLVAGTSDRLTAGRSLQFYAGVPLTTPNGRRVGVLSVVDTEPRTPDEATVHQLEHLGALAGDVLGARRAAGSGPSSLSQAVFDHLPGLFYVLGPDGRVRNWNAQLERATGRERHEIADQPAYDFIAAPDQPKLAEAVLRGFATGTTAVEARFVTAEGRYEPALFSGVRTELDGDPCLVGMGISLAEQKAAEEALRKERDRFETLFENLPTPVVHGISEDDALRVQAVNPAFEVTFGYDREAVRGEDLNELIVPERRQEEAAAVDRSVLDGTGAFQAEVRRTTVMGPRDFQVQAAGRLPDEGPPEVYAIFTDISDRKEMEETLREREALLRTVTENITDGIYRSEPDQGIVYANEAFVDMFGYDSLDEVRQAGPEALYAHPDERERLFRMDRANGAIDQAEVEFERKDGSTFVGLLSSRAVRAEDGSVRYYDGAVTDITERKVYEEQLAYRYDLERELVDISTRFINTPVDDIDSTIEDALGTVGQFVGADRSYVFQVDAAAETTSNTHEWCAPGIASHQPDLQDVPFAAMPWFIDRMHAHEPLVATVSELPSPAAGLREILQEGGIQSLIVLPMVRDDTLVGFVGFDAVEARHDWDSDTVIILRVLSDAIANALQRKAMEERMIVAKNEAEKANRLKSSFLANMSHEIRTPLTSIIGFAEAIGEEVDGLDMHEDTGGADTLHQFADLIERSGRRLLETLNAVLNLSKLEAGEMALDPEAVDLRDEVVEMGQLFVTQAESAGVALQVGDDASASVWADADEGGLRIVLRNLISNAIKYTEEGGTIWVRVRREADTALVEVEDTGIGMDPETVPEVFEAFQQAEADRRHTVKGIGLGLAVTKRLVEQMDGEIAVATEKGEGTRFTVRLPLASRDGRDAPPASRSD